MSTCTSAIVCINDLLFAIDNLVQDAIAKQNYFSQILHFRDAIFNSLISSMSSPSVSEDLKPILFECLSCFFWVVPDYSIAYIPSCVSIIKDASKHQPEYLDDDMVERTNKLYHAIMQLWDSLTAAKSRNPILIAETIPYLLDFVDMLDHLQFVEPKVLLECLTLVQDFASNYKEEATKV